jgi:ribosome-interacting GTPase 1
MPINAHPEYIAAEKEYLNAVNAEEKIEKLKKMISYAPAHKGGENLRAQLKLRMKKLLEQQEKSKKSGKSSKVGIKKGEMQIVLVGFANSGKSSVLSKLTNAKPVVSEKKLSTIEPQIGIMSYMDVNMQIIENPSINSEYYDKGLTNSADLVILVVLNLSEIKEIEKELKNFYGKRLIVISKSDLLETSEKRKIIANLQSKKYNFCLFSVINDNGIEELKSKIFESFDKLRVYTKEPKKTKSQKPIIMEKDSSVKDVAEKILKGLSTKIKETRIWGPSSKFPGQVVGLNHKLKDLDVVEFKTK